MCVYGVYGVFGVGKERLIDNGYGDDGDFNLFFECEDYFYRVEDLCNRDCDGCDQDIDIDSMIVVID